MHAHFIIVTYYWRDTLYVLLYLPSPTRQCVHTYKGLTHYAYHHASVYVGAFFYVNLQKK